MEAFLSDPMSTERADSDRPDVPGLLALLRDPAAVDDVTDILLSLLHCRPEEAGAVERALVERTRGEEDTLVADAIGEALGALWAQHGAPPSETLESLPEIPRAAAMATFAALTK